MAYRLHEVNEDFIKDKLDKQKSSSKFPKIFKTNVDITKITNWPAIKKWIQQRIDQLIPDDEIFVEYVYELIRSDSPCPDIKAIQLQVDDFLGKKDSLEFCTQLWQLLIDSEHGKLKENKEQVKEQPAREQPAREQPAKERSDRKEEKSVQEEHEAKIQSPKKTKTNYNRSSSYTSKSNESTNKTSYRSQSDRDYRRDRDEPTYKANTHGQRQRESPDERYRDERRIRARKGN